jgi:NADH dehydrogenase
MKTIDDALELRRRIFGAFELAELTDNADERDKWLTFVIVGAGPTGVELAGQIRELATRCLKGEFRNFDASTARVILIDGGPSPLRGFGEVLSSRVEKALDKMGIEMQMECTVTSTSVDGATYSDARGNQADIVAGTVIWAAGVQASPLAASLANQCGAALESGGRIRVKPDLSLPGHPEVFVVGDMMALDDLPGVAEVAMQGGLHAANTIVRRLADRDSLPFRYRDLGNVATLGRFRAIATVGPLRLSGFMGWTVWFFVHLAFLEGFGNRLGSMFHWLRSMIGRGRAERQFSTAHTGGDLSLPDAARAEIQPRPYPFAAEVQDPGAR